MFRRFRKYLFYKVSWGYVLADVLLLAFSYLFVLQMLPLTTPIPFQKYWRFLCVFSAFWMFYSYLTHRYVSPKYLKLHSHVFRLLLCVMAILITAFLYVGVIVDNTYSIWVVLAILTSVLLTSLVALILNYAYRYAVNIEPEMERNFDRGAKSVLHPAVGIDDQSARDIWTVINEWSSPQVFERLSKHIDFFSSNTAIFSTSRLSELQRVIYYRFDTVVNLQPLNAVSEINKMMAVVNDKLPDDGRFVCCFETQSTHKQRMLNRFPWGLNYLIYMLEFICFRVLPKVFWSSRLFFQLSHGRQRILSKTEVLGRLCYCGFSIEQVTKINGLTYVIARRKFTPATVRLRAYGLFITLLRKGRDGQMINVYKVRTMHPYSEFLQEYMYDHYHLQEGGKINRDIRVTTLGRVMRKYWLDELPMILNLFRGNMKLVGVRPLSKHYYGLYSQELQELRIRFKPGLIPPFYADMPKTIAEIEASEMKYLRACCDDGQFKTDCRYFMRVLYAIVFKRVRSN